MKQHLDTKEFDVLRLSYGLDCDKHSAKQIANYLGIEGSGAYVRVSQLKKQAVDKLIENVDHSQVLDYLQVRASDKCKFNKKRVIIDIHQIPNYERIK